MKGSSWPRLLTPPDRSFFLFGPRGVGKSTWLRHHFKSAITLDLLRADLFLDLTRRPETLEAIVGDRPPQTWVCIDEVQRIPALLNEVHRLIETRDWRFALSGSSARKLKRGGANLLGGRAITLNMGAPVSAELATSFDVERAIDWGSLPLVVQDPSSAALLLHSYVHTYLREEVLEEGLVRKLEPFTRFLEVAGLLNGQILNLANVARDAEVPRASVDTYFSILDETLLGSWLTSYRPGARVRETEHSKFYWFDAGVARGAAGMLNDPVDRVWQGFALETLVLGEMRVHNHVAQKNRPLHFWRTGGGVEVDFVIETRRKTHSKPAEVVAIEVKRATKWDRRWESGTNALAASGAVTVKSAFGVYCGPRPLHYDGFQVLPVQDFLERLHAGDIF